MLSTSVSPISILPDEILEKIFLLCRDRAAAQDSSNNDKLIVAKDSSVWLVTKVCGHWRRVALALGELWSNMLIGVGVPEYDVRHASAGAITYEFVSTCLKRSKNYPLSFDYWIPTDVPSPSHLAILDALLKHASRWRDIALSIWPPRDDMDPLYRPIHLPELQKLKLTELRRQAEPVHLHMFKDAPRLWSLDIAFFTFPTRRLHINWSQITHYSSFRTVYGPGGLDAILHSMPALEELEMSRDEGLFELQPAHPIFLPKLRVLKLDHRDTKIKMILDMLTVPSLNELELDIFCNPFQPVDIATATISLIQRSSCSITTLGMMEINDGSAIRILDALSGLTSLSLHARPRLVYRDEKNWREQLHSVMRRLTWTPPQEDDNRRDDGLVLPVLCELRIYELPQVDEVLMDMLYSRVVGWHLDYSSYTDITPQKLRSVDLTYNARQVDMEGITQIIQLGEEYGFEMYIH